MSKYYVENGEILNDKIVGNDDYMFISSGGTACGTKFSDGGIGWVRDGGTAKTTMGTNGGQFFVETGGTAGTVILSRGGLMNVYSGGVATGITQKAGGGLVVEVYGKDKKTKISGTNAKGKFSLANGSATNFIISNDGCLSLHTGGKANGTTITSGGMFVMGGGASKDLTVKAGGLAYMISGKLTGKTILAGKADLLVSGIGIKTAGITCKAGSRIGYNIRYVETGRSAMLARSSGVQKLNAAFSVTMHKFQKAGTYKLSSGFTVASKKAFSLVIGSGKATEVRLGAKTMVANGVSYSMGVSKNVISLKLALVAGRIKTGKAGGDDLKGTANCDIFYGGGGNDTIHGGKGRDVAVYDKNNWGHDTICKGKGLMTLVLAGVKRSAVKTKQDYEKGTMTIWKKKDASQKITIKGWSESTHAIVYGAKLTAFNKYLKAAAPTEKQKTAAQNELYKIANDNLATLSPA